MHGPIAAPYAWIVRNVPESGIFRELYDLAGVFAALLVLLACAGTARSRVLGYVALAAGILLPVTWLLRPPSDLWIPSNAYPHPVVVAPASTRVALLPAFQPLGLTAGGGDGADPDAYVYRAGVSALNEYFPTYPVDMALARYELSGDAEPLRALGVSEVIARPWLVSRTRGAIGLAASSLQPRSPRRAVPFLRYVDGTTPLISQCAGPRIVVLPNSLGVVRRLLRRRRAIRADTSADRSERFDRSRNGVDRRAPGLRRVTRARAGNWWCAYAIASSVRRGAGILAARVRAWRVARLGWTRARAKHRSVRLATYPGRRRSGGVHGDVRAGRANRAASESSTVLRDRARARGARWTFASLRLGSTSSIGRPIPGPRTSFCDLTNGTTTHGLQWHRGELYVTSESICRRTAGCSELRRDASFSYR